MTGPHRSIAATRLAVRKALEEIDRATPGGLVLVACSGGADSLALAAAVAFEAPRVALPAGAVVVDHNLQEGSLAVAERAADQCRGLGLDPVEVITVEVGLPGSGERTDKTSGGSGGGKNAGGRSDGSRSEDSVGNDGGNGAGSGPEARARDARYGAFEEVVDRVGAVAVLLGHTRDDQAEQVLLGLARGSGARSLSGMPARRGPYVRPLLAVARATTAAACEAAGLTVWVDPQNSDPAYSRVRARALLPLLEAELGPGAVAALARSADLLRDDADTLDDLATEARAELAGRQTTGLRQGGIDAAALLRLPKAIRTRVWRLLAVEAGCSPGALIASHIDSLDSLVTCWRGQGPIDLPGRVQGSRTDGRVMVAASRQVE